MAVVKSKYLICVNAMYFHLMLSLSKPEIETSLVELVDGNRPLQKAKIVVLMDKIAAIPDIPEDAGDQVV